MSRLFTIGVTALAILCFTPDASQAHPLIPAKAGTQAFLLH